MQTRAHHFVPQVYLQYFTSTPAEANPDKMKIWRLNKNKTTRRSDEARIAKVAQQRDLYTYRPGEENRVSFEEVFSRWELSYGHTLRALHTAPSIDVLLGHKRHLATFVAFQYVRTAFMRELLRQYWELQASDGPPVTTDELKIGHMSLMMRDLDKATDVFHRKNWVLLHNETRALFYTSDTPITIRNPQRGRRTPDLYVTSKGVEIHFPLSPRLALVMYNQGEYRDEEFDIMAGPVDVEALNRQQVRWSQRYVFSATNDFALADRMVDTEPELGNPHRQRLFRPDEGGEQD